MLSGFGLFSSRDAPGIFDSHYIRYRNCSKLLSSIEVTSHPYIDGLSKYTSLPSKLFTYHLT